MLARGPQDLRESEDRGQRRADAVGDAGGDIEPRIRLELRDPSRRIPFKIQD
ncbi:MAG: hypothetical protein AABY75_01970 [Bacteroidota bacterium]